jgi:hypothetical protein
MRTLIIITSSCLLKLLVCGSGHVFMEGFIWKSLFDVCFSHWDCHREWSLFLRTWVISSYSVCWYIWMLRSVFAVARSSASSLPGIPMCDGIYIIFIVLLEACILFWIFWAMLNFVFVFDIADIALIESLSMRILLWIMDREDVDSASNIARISAV